MKCKAFSLHRHLFKVYPPHIVLCLSKLPPILIKRLLNIFLLPVLFYFFTVVTTIFVTISLTLKFPKFLWSHKIHPTGPNLLSSLLFLDWWGVILKVFFFVLMIFLFHYQKTPISKVYGIFYIHLKVPRSFWKTPNQDICLKLNIYDYKYTIFP